MCEKCCTLSAPQFNYTQSPGLCPGQVYHAPLALYSEFIFGKGL
jgi:hypothetical protein